MDFQKLITKIKGLSTTQLINLSKELLSSSTFDDNSDVRVIIEECFPNELFQVALIGLQSEILREMTERTRLMLVAMK